MYIMNEEFVSNNLYDIGLVDLFGSIENLYFFQLNNILHKQQRLCAIVFILNVFFYVIAVL